MLPAPSKRDFRRKIYLTLRHTTRPAPFYSFAEASSSDNDLPNNGGALKPVGDSSKDSGTSHTAEATKDGRAVPPAGSADGAGFSNIMPSSPARTVLAHEDSPESAAYGGDEVDFDRARAAPPYALARRLLRIGNPGALAKPVRDRARFPPTL